MNTEQLSDLIDRMCCKENSSNSDDSISYKAYREAEKLSDVSLLPFLKETILLNQNNNSKDKKLRNSVYFIIGKIIKNSFDESACKFLVERLDVETDKYILSGILDLFVEVNIPSNIDIDPIIRCSESDKWLIRHSAIQALGSSNTEKSKEAIYYYLNQEDEKKYSYEITYANASLGKIGTDDDIPILKKHLTSRKHDIKDSAAFAIKRIENRTN